MSKVEVEFLAQIGEFTAATAKMAEQSRALVADFAGVGAATQGLAGKLTELERKFDQLSDHERKASEESERASRKTESAWQKTINTLSGLGSGVKNGLSSVGTAALFLNQSFELIERGIRGVERTFDATIGRIADRGDVLTNLANRYGTTTEAIARNAFVAKQAGVEVEGLFQAYRALARNIAEAGEKGSDGNRLLVQGLGLTRAEIERLKTLRPEEAIFAVGEALDKYADGAEKSAAGQAIFGRGMDAVMQVVRNGREDMERAIALADRLGVTMDTDTAHAADRLGDALGTVDDAWLGFLTHALGGPDFLNQLAQRTEDAVAKFADMGRSIPDEKIQKLQDAIVGLVDAAGTFATSSGPQMVDVLTKIVNGMAWIVDHGAATAGALVGIATGATVGFATAGPLGIVPGAFVGGVAGGRAGGILGGNSPTLSTSAEIGQTSVPGVGEDIGQSNASPSDYAARPRPRIVVPSAGSSSSSSSQSEVVKKLFADEQQALKDAEEQGALARLDVVREFTERLKGLGEARVDDTRRQLDLERDAERSLAQENSAIARIQRDEDRDAKLAEVDANEKALLQQVADGRISHRAALDDLRAYYQQRHDIIVAALDFEIENEKDPVKRESLVAQRAKADRDLGPQSPNAPAPQRGDNPFDAFGTLNSNLDATFGSISAASDQMVQGMIQGTVTWKEAWANAGQSVVSSLAATGVKMVTGFAADVAKMIAEWAFGEGKKTALLAAGETSRTSVTVAGETAKTGAAVAGETARVAATTTATTTKGSVEGAWTLKSLAMSAAEAAGKVIAAFANLPYGAGIALGVAAAAGIVGIIKAFGVFHQGGEVPGTGDVPSILQGGEIVLPRPIAGLVKSMAAKAGTSPLGLFGAADAAAAGAPGGASPGAASRVAIDPAILAFATQGAAGVSGGAAAPLGTSPAPPPAAESQPFLSAAGGLDRVPNEGALIQAHPGETVLSKDVADTVRDGAKGGGPDIEKPGQQAGGEEGGKGKKADKGDDEKGDGDGKGKKGGKDKSGISPAAAGVTAPAFQQAGGGGGGTGGSGVQRVNVVAASATINTKAKGGNVEATIGEPAQVLAAGGAPIPMQQQGPSQTIIMNAPLPVSFNAIQTMVSATMGISWPVAALVTAGFGTINAFAKGGVVEDDMVAQLHKNEMVLPASIAQAVLGNVRAPREFSASPAQLERTTTSIASRLRDQQVADRTRFMEELVAVLPEGGDHFEQHNNFQFLDGDGAERFIENHGEALASNTWTRTTRQNHGLRRRR